MAFRHQERPFRSDATVLADYALTTTRAYIAPQAAYRSCSGAFVSQLDRTRVQPIDRNLSRRPQTLTYDQTVIRSQGLPFNGIQTPVIHVVTWITTHLPTTPEVWKAELA